MGGTEWHVLTELGSVGGVLVCLYFFLQYVKHRDEDMKKVMERVEGIAKQFDESVREGRREQRETINALLGVQKETVESVGHLSERVGSLEVKIERIPQQITQQEHRSLSK